MLVDKPKSAEQWLECLSLPENVVVVPSGHFVPIVGPETWADGNGIQMTRSQYQDAHGVDPLVVWQAVKEYRVRAGKKDKLVML